jgi:DNA excision repair protein ERCC-2
VSTPKKHYLTLSVHGLVDFLTRKGDIDNRIYNQETMQLGSKIHAGFQRKQGRDYLSEYPLSQVFTRPLGIVTLEGRADGIIVGGPFPIIDEIKSTVAPLEEFYKEQEDWHLSQASCYALMYLMATSGDKCAIRLTYISQKDNSTLVKEKTFSRQELEDKINGLLDAYLSFYQEEFAHKEARDLSCKNLAFPFKKFRSGQREMAKYVYGIAKNGGYFFCEAPTGIGKTMSALYPSLKAFPTSHNDKIFYLTAKGTGASSASSALTRLYASGLKARDSVLRAKEKMCFSPGSNCNPDECPFAKGYYEKIRKATDEALKDNVSFSSAFVTSLAKKYAMCPFELQLDLSLYSDVIICDYNYFFDPLSKLERFFDPQVNEGGKYIALIDEAHNLIERGRDMYSASLSLSSLLEVRHSLVHLKLPSLKKAIKKLIDFFNEEKVSRTSSNWEYSSCPKEIASALESFSSLAKKLNKAEKYPKLPHQYKELSREAHRLSYLFENCSEGSSLYGEKHGDDVSFHLYCLDPSPYLEESLSSIKGAVFFSATLSPIDFYENGILGKEAPYLLLPSPFPPENFSLTLAPLVSTRYRDRAKTYKEVASYLNNFVSARVGNYFIYFPSYEYLENIKPFLSFGDSFIYEQTRDMKEDDRTSFLANFISSPMKTAVGLLIIGGAFSEGIDLMGDRLNGVVVVGIGLPQLSYERDLIKNHFASLGKGYEYAYMDPGINKVMQAVGRLIRSEKDIGSCLLIDDRYLQNDYRDIFARRWENYNVATSPNDVSLLLEDFYKKKRI